ncbi:MAG: CRISPR-associated primase-polymerase type A1 [Acidobacteriota bacterium]
MTAREVNTMTPEQVRALARDEPEAACRALVAAARASSGDATPWAELAEELGWPQAAAAAWRLVTSRRPTLPLAWASLARLLLEGGRSDRALALVHEAEVAGAAGPQLEQVRVEIAATNRREAELAQAPTEAAPMLASDPDLVRFLSIFGGREDVHARQWVDPAGRGGYSPVRGPLTPARLRDHLAGDETLGVYLLRLDGTVTFLAVDLDLRRRALEEARRDVEVARRCRRLVHETLLSLAARLLELELRPLLEDSGFKGRHLWLPLSRPLAGPTAHRLGRRLQASLETHLSPELSVEVFPKQGRVRSGGLGNLIKLPLGLHRRNGRRSTLLDAGGRVSRQPWQLLRAHPLISPEQLERACSSLPEPVRRSRAAGKAKCSVPERGGGRGGGEPSALEASKERSAADELNPEWSELEQDAEVERVLDRCPVLSSLAEEAERERRLDHDRQMVITHVFGHLERGPEVVQALLSSCRNGPTPRATGKRLRGHPMSCARIRQRLPGLTSRVDCSCVFEATPDHYPSPVLHLREEPPLSSEGVRSPPSVQRLRRLLQRRSEIDHQLLECRSRIIKLMQGEGKRSWQLAEGRLTLDESGEQPRLFLHSSHDDQAAPDH